MKHHAALMIAAVVVIGLASALVTPSYAHTHAWSYDSNGISLDHGDALIHGNHGTLARVTPEGMLSIAGKPQTVTPAQRQQLSRYVATVKTCKPKVWRLPIKPGFSLAASYPTCSVACSAVRARRKLTKGPISAPMIFHNEPCQSARMPGL